MLTPGQSINHLRIVLDPADLRRPRQLSAQYSLLDGSYRQALSALGYALVPRFNMNKIVDIRNQRILSSDSGTYEHIIPLRSFELLAAVGRPLNNEHEQQETNK